MKQLEEEQRSQWSQNPIATANRLKQYQKEIKEKKIYGQVVEVEYENGYLVPKSKEKN